MQLPSNSPSWYYHWVALTTSSNQDMSLNFSKFAQLSTALHGIITVLLLQPQVIKMSLTFRKFLRLPKALLSNITVLLLMSSSDKDKTLSRFLILEHEWVTKCQIKVDVPTLILVYWPKIFYWRWCEGNVCHLFVFYN